MKELILKDGKLKLSNDKAQLVETKFDLKSTTVTEVLTFLTKVNNEKLQIYK